MKLEVLNPNKYVFINEYVVRSQRQHFSMNIAISIFIEMYKHALLEISPKARSMSVHLDGTWQLTRVIDIKQLKGLWTKKCFFQYIIPPKRMAYHFCI